MGKHVDGLGCVGYEEPSLDYVRLSIAVPLADEEGLAGQVRSRIGYCVAVAIFSPVGELRYEWRCLRLY